jgi:hypothetical protein
MNHRRIKKPLLGYSRSPTDQALAKDGQKTLICGNPDSTLQVVSETGRQVTTQLRHWGAESERQELRLYTFRMVEDRGTIGQEIPLSLVLLVGSFKRKAAVSHSVDYHEHFG